MDQSTCACVFCSFLQMNDTLDPALPTVRVDGRSYKLIVKNDRRLAWVSAIRQNLLEG